MSKSKSRVMLRVEKGAFVPADSFSVTMLREKGLKIGDVIACEIAKPRNLGFWRLAHSFGQLCVDNIEHFKSHSCHSVLKAIQQEAGIECEETNIDVPGFGKLVCKKPKSLSFDSMDQTVFYNVLRSMCRYVAETYWQGMTEDQVLQMAEIHVGD